MKGESLEDSKAQKNLKNFEKVLDKFDKMCYYIKVRTGHENERNERCLYLVN